MRLGADPDGSDSAAGFSRGIWPFSLPCSLYFVRTIDRTENGRKKSQKAQKNTFIVRSLGVFRGEGLLLKMGLMRVRDWRSVGSQGGHSGVRRERRLKR
jgi:hypothetical protein